MNTNPYDLDEGKVGLTFEHYQEGMPVEELTLVAYDGELYISLRGTVMNPNIPTATSDWYKVSTFGDLLDAIKQVKKNAEKVLSDIEGIKEEALIVLANEKALIEATISDINTRATAIIKTLNDTNTSVQNAENLRKQAETLRAEAEAKRKRIEAIRVANEALRQDEEGKRVAAEAGRSAEFARWQETWAHQQTAITTTIETANEAAARAVKAAQDIEALLPTATKAIADAKAATEAANTAAASVDEKVREAYTLPQFSVDESTMELMATEVPLTDQFALENGNLTVDF